MPTTVRLLVLACAAALVSACAAETSEDADVAPLIRKLDGLGDWHHPITTDSEQAQAFFDQGLALTYGFNHDAAARSYQTAAAYDPRCAMC